MGVCALASGQNRDGEDFDFMQPKKRVGEMIPMNVIEDIKAEIREEMEECATTSIYTRLGFDTALHIIDKHINGIKEK